MEGLEDVFEVLIEDWKEHLEKFPAETLIFVFNNLYILTALQEWWEEDGHGSPHPRNATVFPDVG